MTFSNSNDDMAGSWTVPELRASKKHASQQDQFPGGATRHVIEMETGSLVTGLRAREIASWWGRRGGAGPKRTARRRSRAFARGDDESRPCQDTSREGLAG